MSRFVKVLFALSFMLLATTRAFAGDVSAYFLNTDLSHISLSPSGEYFAVYDMSAKAGLKTDGYIIVKSTATGDTHKKIFLQNKQVSWIAWMSDDTIAEYSRGIHVERQGKKRPKKDVRDTIDVHNIKTGDIKRISERIPSREDSDMVKIDVLAVDYSEPALIALTKKGRSTKLQRINMSGAAPRTLLTGTAQTLTWLLDSRLQARMRIDEGDTSYTLKYYRNEDAQSKNWRHFYTDNTLDSQFKVLAPPEASEDLQVLYRQASDDTTALHTLKLGDAYPHATVFQNDKYDVAGAKYLGPERELYYAYWWEDTLKHKWFDPDRAAIARRVSSVLPAESNWHVEEVLRRPGQNEDTLWLISHNSVKTSPSVSLWNNEARRLTPIIKGANRVADSDIPVKTRMDYTARDGQKLMGYFTPGLRPSRDKKYFGKAQLVVLPHGGPSSRERVGRDRLEWDPWALHFASLGYDVFQPQYRGSGGFGRYFENMGNGQWGRKMQTDIEDGVAALIADGKINASAERTIIGEGYGGYAALMAATQNLDTYKCVTSVNAITDLPSMLESYDLTDPVEKFNYYIWEKMLGHPINDRQMLRAYSPSMTAQNVTAEFFIIHGRANDLVPVAQSEAMHAAVTAAGAKSRLVRFSGIGHDNWNAAQEYDILSAIDSFTQRCMRPAPPQPKVIRPDPPKTASTKPKIRRPKGTGVEVR